MLKFTGQTTIATSQTTGQSLARWSHSVHPCKTKLISKLKPWPELPGWHSVATDATSLNPPDIVSPFTLQLPCLWHICVCPRDQIICYIHSQFYLLSIGPNMTSVSHLTSSSHLLPPHTCTSQLLATPQALGPHHVPCRRQSRHKLCAVSMVC